MINFNKKTLLILAGVFVGSIILAKMILKGNKMTVTGSFDTSTKWYNDSHTRSIVEKLHPKFKYLIGDFFTKVEKDLGLSIYATSGLRTYAQQVALHNQNSNNAKAGYSSHNFGFAVDLNVKNKSGQIFLLKSTSDKRWLDSGVVKIAQDLGIKWGGGGAFGSYRDPVHFYITPNGLSTADLRDKYNAGQKDSNGYVIV